MAFQNNKKENKFRTAVIVVICVILALSMTIPSVAIILNRGGSSSSTSTSTSSSSTTSTSSSSSASTTANILTTSQGYASAFSDLKNAQAKSENPDSYEATFKENYDNWVYALYDFSGSNTLDSAADVNSAYQLVLDSIKDTAASSTDSASYDYYYAYTYFCYAYSLMSCEKTTGDDLSTQLSICYTEGIAYSKSALAASYDKETAGNLATLYYWSGDTTDAIAMAQQVLEQYPDYAICWYNLGNYYYSAGQYQSAQDAYNQALSVDPNDTYGVKSAVNSQLEALKSYL